MDELSGQVMLLLWFNWNKKMMEELDTHLNEITSEILSKKINMQSLVSECTDSIATEMLQGMPHSNHNPFDPSLVWFHTQGRIIYQLQNTN